MSERCMNCAEAAEGMCMCEGRPLALCTRCALKHEQSPGSHEIQPVRFGNCEYCRREAADSLCLCEFPLPVLCQACAPTHLARGKAHQLDSLLAGFVVRSDEDRLRFLARAKALERSERLLRANLQAVDRCQRDIEITAEAVISAATSWMKRKLDELEAVRDRLQKRVDEVLELVQRVRLSDNYCGESSLERMLRESSDEDLQIRLTVFTYQANSAADLQFNRMLSWAFTPSVLESLTVLPVVPAPTILGLPLVFYRQLRMFSLDTFTETSFRLKSKSHINDGSALCLLPNGDIFVCGGEYPVHGLVYLIDPRDGSLRPQANLHTPRRFPGIFCIGSVVWVFGGNDGKRGLANSERYTVNGRGTEALPDMLSPREKFSPCQWRRKIILAGGIGTTSVEMLDIDRRVYEALPMRLPAADCTIAVLRDNDLVILQSNQLLVCDLDSPTLDLRAHVPEGSWWSNLQPVIHNGCAFFFKLDFSLLFDRGLVDVLVSSFKKVVNIHRASLYALHLETLELRDLRDIHY